MPASRRERAQEQPIVAAERHYKAIASAITASTAHGDAGLKAKAGTLLLGEYAGKVSLTHSVANLRTER